MPLETKIDPRVVRTRQLLLDSFYELKLERTNIQAISVLDIAERAGVNRATFYAHFSDKYELLDVWMRDFFRTYLKDKLPVEPRIDHDTLYALINATLDALEHHNQHRKHINKQYEPVFDGALQQELHNTLAVMLANSQIDNDTMRNHYLSTFLSWAIFGSANEWGRTKLHPKKTVAQDLFSLVADTLNEHWSIREKAKK